MWNVLVKGFRSVFVIELNNEMCLIAHVIVRCFKVKKESHKRSFTIITVLSKLFFAGIMDKFCFVTYLGCHCLFEENLKPFFAFPSVLISHYLAIFIHLFFLYIGVALEDYGSVGTQHITN